MIEENKKYIKKLEKAIPKIKDKDEQNELKMKEKSKCGQEQSKKKSFRISYARACLRLRGSCSIVVDNFRGTVKEIGIRTTQIEDAGGNVKVVTNSDIRTLVNMTSQLSLAISEVDIEYGESLERVELVIKDNLKTIRNNIPDIAEGPFYII